MTRSGCVAAVVAVLLSAAVCSAATTKAESASLPGQMQAPSGPNPSYDHQTTTYTSSFEPEYSDNQVSLTPFFSPDHSISTLTELIENVSYGGTVEVGTPGFGSWSGCTPFQGCQGCSIYNQSKEEFPIFHALLNAVHVKKATVRILTNNYNTPTCAGKIAPLDFLALNGVEVKYYATTTFYHAKYITVDGNKTAVSSVNWSYTSFMENREAGVIIGEGGADLIDFAMRVFEADWDEATDYVVTNTYTAAQLKVIRNAAYQDLNIPKPRYNKGAYVTPKPYAATATTSLIYTSPDHAFYELLRDVNSTKETFQLAMYQVTDFTLCRALQDMHARGVDLTVFVSKVIYDAHDEQLAQECYAQLHGDGITVHLSPWYYTYAHAKYWICDKDAKEGHVGMSTGNWSPTDYPQASVFPPFGQPGWINSNRDYTMRMWGSEVVAQFDNVFSEDLQRGTIWSPSTSMLAPSRRGPL